MREDPIAGASQPQTEADPAGEPDQRPVPTTVRRLSFRTLRIRLFAAFLVLGLVLLLTVGAGMFVLLRDLHRQAVSASLADVAVPVASQARVRLGAFLGGGEGPLSPRALQQLRAIEHPEDIAVFLLADDGRVVDLDGTAEGPALPPRLDLDAGERRGQVTRGVFRVPAGADHSYVATTLFGGNAQGGARALVVSRVDDSGARAVSDLARMLLVAAVPLLLVGIPLAWLTARSVTRPLERLSQAAAAIGRGTLPPPLPVSGPDEAASASASFNAMTAEVAHTRNAQAELLASLRHDLRTPLTVIGGFAEALGDGTATGRDASRAAQAIVEETARMGRLVDDLATLEELSASGRRLHLEQLDATSLARTAVARFAGPAAARGQQVTATVPPTPLMFVADALAVERILANLVGNALAAAPEATGHVTIEARSVADRSVMLAVRDDGPGIPSGAMSHVFERFYRADPSRSGTGSGLGLAIVAQLAHAHGGRAFAENLPEGGARVGVTLPASPPLDRY